VGALAKPDVTTPAARPLVDALHELHHRAGWPSLRDLGRRVGVSRTTVAAAFSAPKVPRWGVLELIVEALGGDIEEFHGLWLTATGMPGREACRTPDPDPPGGPQGEESGARIGANRASGSSTQPDVPRHLPAGVRGFTGRADALAALDGLALRDPDANLRIAVISGTAGVGKTALAVQWAHRRADRFPDGQLFVNLRGYDPQRPLPASEALGMMLGALGVPAPAIPTALAERAAAYRSALAGRRVLVVLDNARSCDQLRDLLPGAPGCMVLVTSRDSLPSLVARYGAVRHRLGLLPPTDAVTLLHALVGPRVAEEPVATRELAERCARLPLALRLVAELAVSRPGEQIADLVAELDAGPDRLDLLDAGDDDHTAIRAVFSWSTGSLPMPARRAFRFLALHPGPDIDAWATAAMLDADVVQARRLLTVLERAHLIESTAVGRYAMHDLLKEYAREIPGTPGTDDERAALRRLFEYFRSTACSAVDVAVHRGIAVTGAAGRWNQVSPTGWLEAERPNLLAVAESAADVLPVCAKGLSAALAVFLDSRGHYADAIHLHAAAARAATAERDLAGQAAAFGRLGVIHRRLGRYPEAESLQQRALLLHRRAGDRPGEAAALTDLGILSWRCGRYATARDYLDDALAVRRDLGDRTGQGAVLSNLGIVHRRMGQYDTATECHRQSLAIYQEVGDRPGEARASTNLGVLKLRLGHYDEALRLHVRALDIQRRHGDRAGECVALTNVGLTLERLGRYQDATSPLEQALAIARDIGYRVGQADALQGLGILAGRQGHGGQALSRLESAVTIAHEIGEAVIETGALNDLGEVLLHAGRRAEARTRHSDALRLAVANGDRYEQGRAHAGLARLDASAGLLSSAAIQWQQALPHFVELGMPEAGEVAQRLAEIA